MIIFLINLKSSLINLSKLQGIPIIIRTISNLLRTNYSHIILTGEPEVLDSYRLVVSGWYPKENISFVPQIKDEKDEGDEKDTDENLPLVLKTLIDKELIARSDQIVTIQPNIPNIRPESINETLSNTICLLECDGNPVIYSFNALFLLKHFNDIKKHNLKDERELFEWLHFNAKVEIPKIVITQDREQFIPIIQKPTSYNYDYYLGKPLILADIDGTICHSGETITDQMLEMLFQLLKYCNFGFVGGGTHEKIVNQLGPFSKSAKYIFSNNGSTGWKYLSYIYQLDIRNTIDDKMLTKINNFLLMKTAELELPTKTGGFINLRSGLIYYTPIGSNCLQTERRNFIEWDKKTQLRSQLVQEITDKFPFLDASLGGELGIAIYPKGWNKSKIYEYITENDIFFFGDKISPLGNDYPAAMHNRVRFIGKVDSPEETYQYFNYILTNFENP